MYGQPLLPTVFPAATPRVDERLNLTPHAAVSPTAPRALLYGALHCWRHRRRALVGAVPLMATALLAVAVARMAPNMPPGVAPSVVLWLVWTAPPALSWVAACFWLASAGHAAGAPCRATQLVWRRDWRTAQFGAVMGLGCAPFALVAAVMAAAPPRWHAVGLPLLLLLAGFLALLFWGRAAAALACPQGFRQGWLAGRRRTARAALAQCLALALAAAALMSIHWLFIALNALGMWEVAGRELAAAGWSALWREPVSVLMAGMRVASFLLWGVFALALSAATAGRMHSGWHAEREAP